MPAKSRVAPFRIPLLVGLLAAGTGILGGVGPAQAAAPKPTLVLYPRTTGVADDLNTLVEVRKKLRADGRFQVLTYDPESFAVKRAAEEAHHPEWLTRTVSGDTDRLALARALGAAFLAVVAPAQERGKADVHLLEAAPAARAWEFTGQKTDDAARAIEHQAEDALAHPAAASPPVVRASRPAPLPAVPVAAKPPVPSAPPVTTPPATAPPVSTPPPAQGDASPAPPPAPKPADSAADDLASIAPLLSRGDQALSLGNVVEAISLYRQAINQAPLSTVPRLRLAKAYLQGGLRDKALDEAKRALEIAPASVPVQEFLIQLDAESGTSEGATTRYQALVARNPQDASAHLGLGDAFWNNGSLADAEAEYKTAERLSGPDNHDAAAHLARLYAAQARYDESLAALKEAGESGYALALSIVQNRADALSSTIDAARQDFETGKSTREKFYDTAKAVSAQSQSLADFVAKITPPAAYKLSYLHRMLATNLLAQEAAVLVTYIETSDSKQSEKAAQLEKAAQTEMLTAHAAEQKSGLWGAKGE